MRYIPKIILTIVSDAFGDENRCKLCTFLCIAWELILCKISYNWIGGSCLCDQFTWESKFRWNLWFSEMLSPTIHSYTHDAHGDIIAFVLSFFCEVVTVSNSKIIILHCQSYQWKHFSTGICFSRTTRNLIVFSMLNENRNRWFDSRNSIFDMLFAFCSSVGSPVGSPSLCVYARAFMCPV